MIEYILRISLILKKVVMFIPPASWVHVAEDIIAFSRMIVESPLLASRLDNSDDNALQIASNLLFVIAFMPQQFSPTDRIKFFEYAFSLSSSPLFWIALKRLPLLILLVKNSSSTLFKTVMYVLNTIFNFNFNLLSLSCLMVIILITIEMGSKQESPIAD